jgi:hypothetical protein
MVFEMITEICPIVKPTFITNIGYAQIGRCQQLAGMSYSDFCQKIDVGFFCTLEEKMTESRDAFVG